MVHCCPGIETGHPKTAVKISGGLTHLIRFLQLCSPELFTHLLCCAFDPSYYWLKGKASQVCHTETGPAPGFLSSYSGYRLCSLYTETIKIHINDLWLHTWRICSLEPYFSWPGCCFFVLYRSLSTGNYLAPVIGMFLPQLTLVYILPKQWRSVGAKHKRYRGELQHARHALDALPRRSSCREIRPGGYHLASLFNLELCSMWRDNNMGPLVEDTVEDLRNIQRSLCAVSSAACSGTHGFF